MKKLLFLITGMVLLGAGFAGGIIYEMRAQRQKITEIEAVALEACTARVQTIKKLCKKGC